MTIRRKNGRIIWIFRSASLPFLGVALVFAVGCGSPTRASTEGGPGGPVEPIIDTVKVTSRYQMETSIISTVLENNSLCIVTVTGIAIKAFPWSESSRILSQNPGYLVDFKPLMVDGPKQCAVVIEKSPAEPLDLLKGRCALGFRIFPGVRVEFDLEFKKRKILGDSETIYGEVGVRYSVRYPDYSGRDMSVAKSEVFPMWESHNP